MPRLNPEGDKVPQLRTGGCLCGGVRFTVAGRPLQVLVCHCTLCQRATGSAFSIEPVFLKESVSLRGDALRTYSHRSVDHGRLIHFSFCGRCGTRIGLEPVRFAGVQILYAGTFDAPASFIPEVHIFTASALPWVVLPSDIRCFRRHMFFDDGSPASPVI
jgi:hypothetical protein